MREYINAFFNSIQVCSFLMGSITRLIEHIIKSIAPSRRVTCLFIKWCFLVTQQKIQIYKMCCLLFKPKHPLFIIPTDNHYRSQEQQKKKLVFFNLTWKWPIFTAFLGFLNKAKKKLFRQPQHRQYLRFFLLKFKLRVDSMFNLLENLWENVNI